MKKVFVLIIASLSLAVGLSCVENTNLKLRGLVLCFSEEGRMLPEKDMGSQIDMVADGGAMINLFGEGEDGVKIGDCSIILEYNLEITEFEPIKVTFARKSGVITTTVSYKDRVVSGEERGLADAAAEVLGDDGIVLANEAIRLGFYQAGSDPAACAKTLLSLIPIGGMESRADLAPTAREGGSSLWLDIPTGPLVKSICASGSIDLVAGVTTKSEFFALCLSHDPDPTPSEGEGEGEGEKPPLTVKVLPETVEINTGQKAVFRVEVSGGQPPYTYEWRKKDAEGNFQLVAGAETEVLVFENATIDDAGEYQCAATDSEGKAEGKKFAM